MNIFGKNGFAAASKHLASSSALNPTLSLSLVAVAGGYGLAYFAPPPMSYAAFVVGTLPVLIACWQIVRFTLIDPDRLQHDTHVENKMMISLIGENSDSGTKQIIIKNDTPMIDNPHISDGGI